MEVGWHDNIRKDLKKLKRYSAPEESLEAWVRLFCVKGLRETPGVELFDDFGSQRVYKARVVPLQENVGKSHGYRLVFRMISLDKILLLVFLRHGIYKHERELITLVKERLF